MYWYRQDKLAPCARQAKNLSQNFSDCLRGLTLPTISTARFLLFRFLPLNAAADEKFSVFFKAALCFSALCQVYKCELVNFHVSYAHLATAHRVTMRRFFNQTIDSYDTSRKHLHGSNPAPQKR